VFKTIDERNRYVIEMRMQGHTLQDIANSIDLTREMVRLIVEAHSGPTSSEVRRIRERKRKDEVLEVFNRRKVADVDQLAEELGIDQAKVRKYLGSKAKRLKHGRKEREKYYSDAALKEILQKAKSKVSGPLTTKKYVDLCTAPTVAVFISRFGSWSQACSSAGIEHGKAARSIYKRAHTEEDMLAYVASYLADPRTSGSAQGYEEWQRKVEGAPSLSLIRQRIGKWNEIKDKLMKET
jgi:predicted transcriptional regulator